MPRPITMLGATVISVGIALGARALASQPDPATGPTPRPAEAQVDVSGCQACHGPDGISPNPRIPNLAGQQPDYLVAQLQAFKRGTRTNASMQAITARLSDAEITALARYWSARPAEGDDAHAAAIGSAIPSRMTFPANFPAGFTLYRTTNAEGLVTERYANAAALAAVRAGRPLPDRSVIMVVTRPAPSAAPAGYAGMESRAGWGAAIPKVLRNANWNYAAFDAQGVRNDRLNQAQCLACHLSRVDDSYVFTLSELREFAQRAR